ncbi:hypothetical protein [Lichenifustis flavocetrariae]|uniref:Uncharacterized protein n=1 Tax=Lichenifustis flavocetrariae TaxID=2949735 RepID=A0AA41Z0U8_9HYPH|nr:hypothetical protein [Lichenifustis flavocetrariae]MCW6512126.1 hypothetical protein [Lichenifustis flavocetrariae]
MINLKRLISDAADAFDQVSTLDFPLLVGNGDAGGNEQLVDSSGISHLSHFSHHELSQFETEDDLARILIENQRAGARAIGDASKTVGKVGAVGNASKCNGLFFPLIISKVGKVGKDGLAGNALSTTIFEPVDDESDWIPDHAASLHDAGVDDVAPYSAPAVTGSYAREPARRVEAQMVSTFHARARVMLRERTSVVGLPADWIEGALTLSPDIIPCPGFRDGQWTRTYGYMLDFLTSPLAIAAAGYEWPTVLLFGVHPTVGLANVSGCGACVLADRDPIIEVKYHAILFERMSFYRPPAINPSVPVWRFGR